MHIRRVLCAALLLASWLTMAASQEAPVPQLLPGTARKPSADSKTPAPQAAPPTIALTVPKGTPLQVAIDCEVRVKKVGQPVHARVVEPVYAFDHVVIPVGAEVTGQLTGIAPISGGKRTLAALDADFSPARQVEVSFTELVLADRRRFPFETSVTPGSGQVIRFITAADDQEKKKGVKNAASEKTKEAKEQARQQWEAAMKELKTPGHLHRLKRYLEAQLPVHGQYIPVGTVYFAELKRPLDFGTEVMTPEMASTIGLPIPPGSVVHARLVTPLSSASAHKGQEVEAVLSQPLLDPEKHLILPQGSQLKGAVRQAAPARYRKRNGQLRIAFQELIPPDGVQQKVEATLEAVQASKEANVKLDSEGGAEATTPKTRYLATAVSLTLAAASAHTDNDANHGGTGAAGDTSSRVAGGINGFKLVGMALGFTVHSRALGYAMGAYGAGMSVYSNFIAKGREVVFPKNTAMEIGVGMRKEAATEVPPRVAVASSN
jgi:hypothetical protein